MQPTTLNKIVSLFLVGGLVILGIGAILLHQFGAARLADAIEALAGGGGQAFFAVVSGALLLPVAAFAGAVSEGLTAIFIREPVKWLARQRWALVLLRQTDHAWYQNFWQARFVEVAAQSETLEGFPLGINNQGLAVGILYDRKLEQAVQWAESHYSMYVLVSNFAFLSVVAELYLLLSGCRNWLDWSTVGWGSTAMAAMFYVLLGVSLDRYFYSYEIALRQAAVGLRAQHSQPALPRLAVKIETKDLILRPLLEDDRSRLIALLSDAEVMKLALGGKPLSQVEADHFITQKFAAEEESLFPRLGTLCLRSTSEVIGFAGYMPCRYLDNKQDFEFGFVISPEHQRKGYATQIGQELLDMGLNTVRLRRLLACCHPENRGFRKILEKNLKMTLVKTKEIPDRGRRCIFRKDFTP